MDHTIATHLDTIDRIGWFSNTALKGDLPEDARFYQTHPGTAHIHWLVGHVAFSIDKITLPALEGPSEIPDSLTPIFGWGSKPTPDRAIYPSWNDTVDYLTDAVTRLRAHVASLTPERLTHPLPQDHPFGKWIPTRGAIVPFTGMHSTYHLGQISLLRRAQGLPSGMGM